MRDTGTLSIVRREASAAVKAGDVDRLRDLLVVGSTFASLTIRQRTETAEADFERWIALGRPANMSLITGSLLVDRQRRLDGVLALSDADIMNIYRTRDGLDAAELLASLVIGFGPVKASFALACSGHRQAAACFDTHLLRKHAGAVEASGFNRYAKTGNKRPAWAAYRALCEAVYGSVGRSAAGQWAEWLRDYGRGTVHTALADAVAGL